MSFDQVPLYTYWLLAAFVFCLLYIAIHLLLKLYKDELPSDINWLDPPKNKLKISNGLDIAYRQSGTGKDLLLIHGIGGNTFCWRFVYPILNKKYRVTCLDLPGFGYSSKSQHIDCGLDSQSQSVKLFIDGLGLKKPILVGSSMGGTIALWLGVLYPAQFTKIIAIAPAAGVRLIPRVFRRIKSVSYYLNWGLNHKTMTLILKHIFANNKLVSSYSVNGYLKPYLQNKTDSIHGFVSAKYLIQDNRLPNEFEKLKSKPLILAARKDKMVKKKNIKNLLKFLSNYEFHLNDLAGHHIMEDDPDWVLDKINNYIDS